MKTALIHVPFVSVLKIPPLAPALLKSCLQQDNIESCVFDFNLKFQKEFPKEHKDIILTWFITSDVVVPLDSYNAYTLFVQTCVNQVIEYDADAIGISVFSHNGHRFVEDFCFHYKKAKQSYILIGGSGLQTLQNQFGKNWSELMLDSNLADCALHGEGEFLIGDLISNRVTGLVKNPQLDSENLRDLPPPNFDDYDLDQYGPRDELLLPITSSRGCVRSCTFCDVAKLWPKFRHRQGKNVANDIVSIYERYKIKNFSFTDSLINGGLKPFREMNEVLSATLPNTINYEGQFICRNSSGMPPSDFKLMKSGGCNTVSIGIESGSENVRSHMKKGFSNQDIEYTTDQLISNDIKQQWNIIVGYPTETDNDWNDTLNLIKKYKKYSDMIKISPVGVFQFLHNIPLREKDAMDSLGLISQIDHGYDEYNWIATINPTNTFKIRANRWFYLVELLKDVDMLLATSNVDQKSIIIKQQMQYYESKSDKVTIPIIPYSLQSSTDFNIQ